MTKVGGKEQKLIYRKGNPVPSGASVQEGGINFAFTAGEGEETSLILYDKGTGVCLDEFLIPGEMYYGNVSGVFVKGLAADSFVYQYRCGNELKADPCARIIYGKEEWGKVPEHVTCGVYQDRYHWGDDRRPEIPFEDSVIYRLHVRGFTYASGMEEKKRGTFAGIQAKIPYLKALGVTMVELMPAYDFYEKKPEEGKPVPRYLRAKTEPKMNYWGFTDGFYYAPKASYSMGKTTASAIKELKDLVKALHREGMELSMEFFFPEGMYEVFMLEALREWVDTYHLDGIRISGEERLVHAAMADPRLAGVKLVSWIWPYDGRTKAVRKGVLQDDFMIAVREFIKGEEGKAGLLSQRLWEKPESGSILHYLAKHDTFSLYDTVSYDRKHNEPNGESNRDGAVYNYSWNCGAEGPTKSRKVLNLRKRQMKNAIALLFLSAGVPVIQEGDERARTRLGNNNPYCQDNETNWLDWNTNGLQREILSFTKEMIAFRKAHPIFRKTEKLQTADYRALGLPELSYHGKEAWYPQFDHVSKEFGMMVNGAYAQEKDGLFFIALNMNASDADFGVPSPGTGKKWVPVLSTGSVSDVTWSEDGRTLRLKERTIAILEAETCGIKEKET